MSNRVVYSFSLTADDVRKLDEIVAHHNNKLFAGFWSVSISRTSMLRHLIAVEFAAIEESCLKVSKSVELVKKRKKAKSAKIQAPA